MPVKKFIKSKTFKLFLILFLFVISLLIVLPRTPIIINKGFIKVDTSIGGYLINLFQGRYVLDLRDFKKGLDLAGGVRIVLSADMTGIPESERSAALESAKSVIDRRVNFLGVSEPYILPVRSGSDYRIIVELPGVSNTTSAINLIGQTAQLRFKTLKPEFEWSEDKVTEYYVNPDVWQDTNLTGADLRTVNVVFTPSSNLIEENRPSIQLGFTSEGQSKFSGVAKENINKPIAIFLDDGPFPLSMPVVDEDLASGNVGDPVISGDFNLEQAKTLSIQLRAGALPVPVKIIEQTVIGATLGESAVEASYLAGLVGIVFLFIFMILSYGKLGLVADLALILYILILLAIFKVIPVVITLPGIAGFLLSIGIAVDANILIFERLKEEIQAGRPKSLALKLGFDRAWPSIRDSNVSSLITALILFYLGTGSIRGFALTLIIGMIVSLFTAIFVVRFILETFYIDTKKKSVFSRLKFRKLYARN